MLPYSLQLLALHQGLTHFHCRHLHHCLVPSLWEGEGEGVGVLQCLVAGSGAGEEGYYPVGPGFISSCSSRYLILSATQ